MIQDLYLRAHRVSAVAATLAGHAVRGNFKRLSVRNRPVTPEGPVPTHTFRVHVQSLPEAWAGFAPPTVIDALVGAHLLVDGVHGAVTGVQVGRIKGEVAYYECLVVTS